MNDAERKAIEAGEGIFKNGRYFNTGRTYYADGTLRMDFDASNARDPAFNGDVFLYMEDDQPVFGPLSTSSTPPLQAPSHGDVVREALDNLMGAHIFLLSKYEYSQQDIEDCTSQARAALTAPAAKAPAVSEADVAKALKPFQQPGLISASIDREEKYLHDLMDDEDAGFMHGDIEGAFHRIKDLIQSAAPGGGAETFEELRAQGGPLYGATKSDGGVEGHAISGTGPASEQSRQPETPIAGIKPGPSDPPSQEASAPKGEV